MTVKKDNKLSGHEQVVRFLDALEHPLKSEIEMVRKIVLEANGQLLEHIKWNAPSFYLNHNDDRITFNLHGKDGFRLIFHCGSKVTAYAKGEPILEDKTQLLEWITGDRATVRFRSTDEIEENRENLKHIIKNWIERTKDI